MKSTDSLYCKTQPIQCGECKPRIWQCYSSKSIWWRLREAVTHPEVWSMETPTLWAAKWCLPLLQEISLAMLSSTQNTLLTSIHLSTSSIHLLIKPTRSSKLLPMVVKVRTKLGNKVGHSSKALESLRKQS
jgi:hypothetical protein